MCVPLILALLARTRSGDERSSHPPHGHAVARARLSAHLRQLGRFCAVGLTCLALSVAVLIGLHHFAGVNYLLAYVASFIAGNLCGYLLNAHFTFAVSHVNHAGAVRYMMVNGTLLCVNTGAMRLLVGELHLWYIGAAILLAAANTPLSFLAQRFVTYRVGTTRRARSA